MLRGTGFASLIDPVTRKELDEKKRRELAHQEPSTAKSMSASA